MYIYLYTCIHTYMLIYICICTCQYIHENETLCHFAPCRKGKDRTLFSRATFIIYICIRIHIYTHVYVYANIYMTMKPWYTWHHVAKERDNVHFSRQRVPRPLPCGAQCIHVWLYQYPCLAVSANILESQLAAESAIQT